MPWTHRVTQLYLQRTNQDALLKPEWSSRLFKAWRNDTLTNAIHLVSSLKSTFNTSPDSSDISTDSQKRSKKDQESFVEALELASESPHTGADIFDLSEQALEGDTIKC